MSGNYIIIHIFYYFLIWTSITIPLAVFGTVYGHNRKKWKVGVVIYAVLVCGIWGLTKTQIVTTISFMLPVILLLNNFIFLKGAKGFKVSLAFTSYVISICIESITATILATLSILFPELHIISVNIGRFGNTVTIALVCSIESIFILIVYYFIKKLLKQFSYMVNARLLIRITVPVIITMMLSNISGIVPAKWSAITIHLLIAWISAWIAWRVYRKGLELVEEQERHHMDEIYEFETTATEIQYLHRMDKEYKKSRHWNHDIKNHLMAIEHLISKEKYEEAEKYIRELTEQKSEENNGNIFKKI